MNPIIKSIACHVVAAVLGGAVFFMIFWSLCCDTLPWQTVAQ